MYPRNSVGLSGITITVDTVNPLDQGGVVALPTGRWTYPPGVVARPRHSQNPAHKRYGVIGLLYLDKGEDHRYLRLLFSSLAKKAVALRRTSRSSLRTLFSFLRRLSSSRSSVVSP